MSTAPNDHKDILQKAIRSDVFRLAVKNAFNHIIITDADGVIVYANSAVERITGYPRDEVIGRTPRLWGQQMPDEYYQEMWHNIKDEKKPFSGEITNKRKDGELYVAKAIISPILDQDNNLVGFIGTEEDITQQKQLDQMKSEFISITAHQLKTPMTSMQWNLELLEEQLAGHFTPDIRSTLDSVIGVNQELLMLVDDLLNITRLESGRLSINPEETDVSATVVTLLSEMEPAYRAKNISISFDQPENITLTVDKRLLKEVYHNLFDNAVKYSPADSQITISLYKDEGGVVLSVQDQGIGITGPEKERIFEKHFRAQGALDQKVEGTGLGLYFVKLIADATGSHVWFDSTPGQGTTFYFRIPHNGMEVRQGDVGLVDKD